MFRLHFTIATMVSIADPRALCNPMAFSDRWILDKRRSIWSHAEILITKFQTLPDCCRELFLVAAALNRPPGSTSQSKDSITTCNICLQNEAEIHSVNIQTLT